jgi:hypothetical protein
MEVDDPAADDRRTAMPLTTWPGETLRRHRRLPVAASTAVRNRFLPSRTYTIALSPAATG